MSLGQRKVLCDAPHPSPPCPSRLTYQVLSVGTVSQRDGDKEEPQVGKKARERKDSESLVRVKERAERDPGILACGTGIEP